MAEEREGLGYTSDSLTYDEAQKLHLTTSTESPKSHPDLAKQIVEDWAREGLGVPEETSFYVVGGSKALVSSTYLDARYYEVTYDFPKKQAYVDTYRKTHNHVVNIIEEN